jgi:hypothetical protein
MNRDNRHSSKDTHQRRIERALARLEAALRRCREEDVRYGLEISAALSFLALHADEQSPFDQFREALADPGMDGTKPEARWQALNASLNGIKQVIRR